MTVKGNRVHVSAVGPYDGAGVVVDPDLAEELWVTQWFKHGPPEVFFEIYDPFSAIVERELEVVAIEHVDRGNVYHT